MRETWEKRKDSVTRIHPFNRDMPLRSRSMIDAHGSLEVTFPMLRIVGSCAILEEE